MHSFWAHFSEWVNMRPILYRITSTWTNNCVPQPRIMFVSEGYIEKGMQKKTLNQSLIVINSEVVEVHFCLLKYIK